MISNGRKLTAQKAWRGTMVHGRPDRIDNPDPGTRLERRSEVIQQGDKAVRLRDTCALGSQCRANERATSDRASHRD